MHTITACKAMVCMLIHFLALEQEECAVLKGCVSEGVGTGQSTTHASERLGKEGCAVLKGCVSEGVDTGQSTTHASERLGKGVQC